MGTFSMAATLLPEATASYAVGAPTAKWPVAEAVGLHLLYRWLVRRLGMAQWLRFFIASIFTNGMDEVLAAAGT